MTRKILVIEDNQDLAKLLELHLRDLSFDVDLAFEGSAGFKKLNDQPYDLVILDLMLPGMDGMEICRRIRGKQSYTPILILTSKSTELDRVLGLEMGADDYVTKPFSIRELMARVKAIFRRVDEIKGHDPAKRPSIVRIGGFSIDPQSRTARLGDQMLNLTAKEFDLLLHFASHPGRVYTRSQLLDEVWGYGHDGYEHTVNSHINRLRGKIEINPAKPDHIITVWGVGYKFDALEDG
ncbi:response regulator transcription factor [Desulfospira joergensenii]|uniref:response regulator transcription factor n=1 Tax=Desulfospira joergensenii TaxID=53329 RepID=UPI0003B4BCDF|nr:response regulator transcription factor [Desulfospira joergensenii]